MAYLSVRRDNGPPFSSAEFEGFLDYLGMSVVSPTSRFAYKSIRLHRGRFAYTTKSFRLHGLSRFAYIKVVSPTLIFFEDR